MSVDNIVGCNCPYKVRSTMLLLKSRALLSMMLQTRPQQSERGNMPSRLSSTVARGDWGSVSWEEETSLQIWKKTLGSSSNKFSQEAWLPKMVGDSMMKLVATLKHYCLFVAVALLLELRTCNNTDGNKPVIFSSTALGILVCCCYPN